jgi:hypothetical protein
MARIINIYISHAWSHGDGYDKLFRLIQAETADTAGSAISFAARLNGLPKHDAVHVNPAIDELRSAMRYPMSRSQVLVVPTGAYGRYARWIDLEIELARTGYDMRRRILAIDLFAPDAKPTPVQRFADRVIPWTRSGIIAALTELAERPLEPVPAAELRLKIDEFAPRARQATTTATVLPAQFRAAPGLRRSAFGRA